MPLILETPDELRWAEEIAELKRFGKNSRTVAIRFPSKRLFRRELSCENICRI